MTDDSLNRKLNEVVDKVRANHIMQMVKIEGELMLHSDAQKYISGVDPRERIRLLTENLSENMTNVLDDLADEYEENESEEIRNRAVALMEELGDIVNETQECHPHENIQAVDREWLDMLHKQKRARNVFLNH